LLVWAHHPLSRPTITPCLGFGCVLFGVWWWQVYQEYMVVPSLSLVPALARVLTHCAASDPAYKVIVFFPTARFTGCVCTHVRCMCYVGTVCGGVRRSVRCLQAHACGSGLRMCAGAAPWP
jgi:hypothetical protein